ncbi:restriction endonuclease subunit S, partial [Frederiksenia canicola]
MNLNKMRIEEFCKTGSGGTPSRKNESYYQGNIPWVKSGDLREKAIIETEEYISELALKESSAKLVEKGAILLAMYGATVGRMARLGVNAATNQAVCHIIPDENIVNAQYLYYALLNKVPEFLEKAVGGAQPNINQGVIKATEIYLPSLSTQTQIAQILDKSTALIAKRNAQIAELDKLVQSVFLEMFGDPFSNEDLIELDDIFEIIDGDRGRFYPKANEFFDKEYCLFLNAKNVTKNGFDFLNNQFISKEKDEQLRKGKLSRNDIVLTTRGTVGNIALYDENIEFENVRINSGMV